MDGVGGAFIHLSLIATLRQPTQRLRWRSILLSSQTITSNRMLTHLLYNTTILQHHCIHHLQWIQITARVNNPADKPLWNDRGQTMHVGWFLVGWSRKWQFICHPPATSLTQRSVMVSSCKALSVRSPWLCLSRQPVVNKSRMQGSIKEVWWILLTHWPLGTLNGQKSTPPQWVTWNCKWSLGWAASNRDWKYYNKYHALVSRPI